MESKKKKEIMIIGIIVFVVVVILGVAYAIFTYNQTGSNSKLIVGDIYMHYKESNTLTLENALPSNIYDPNNYFEFTIEGKNTNKKYDIWYDINLLRGSVPDSKQESNRILDKFLKFRLTEFVENKTTHELEEKEIFANKSYNDLSSANRIHVATIPKNTTSEITHRYRLYMWIGNEVVIGNTGNDGIDYDMTTWNNLFASIKVSSTGDFTVKEMEYPETPAHCFTTSENQDGTLTITGYDGSCGGNVVIPSQIDVSLNPSQSKYENDSSNLSKMPNTLDSSKLVRRTDNNNLKTVTAIGTSAFKCYNGLCGNFEGSLFANDDYAESSIEYNNSDYEIYNGEIALDDDLDSIVNTLVIPNTVVTIGNSAFYKNNISTLVIPDSVETIGNLAFFKCSISNLDLGNGVKTIGNNAFMSNSITSLTLPSSLIYEEYAFLDNSITNVIVNNTNLMYLTGAFSHFSDPIGFSNEEKVSITLNIPEIPEYYFTNDDNKFNDRTFDINLTEVVTSIAYGAFYSQSINFNRSCSQLESMDNYPWLASYIYGNNVKCYDQYLDNFG